VGVVFINRCVDNDIATPGQWRALSLAYAVQRRPEGASHKGVSRMKQGIWIVAAVAVLSISSLAQADEWPAIAPCRGTNALVNGFGIAGNSTTAATEIWCPLKKMNISANQTLTADVYGDDLNSTNDDDHNIRCRLEVAPVGQSGWSPNGASYTTDSTYNTQTSFSLSTTVSSSYTNAWVAVHCWLGIDGTGGHSYIYWIGNTNF
jgi:hypothetical protein